MRGVVLWFDDDQPPVKMPRNGCDHAHVAVDESRRAGVSSTVGSIYWAACLECGARFIAQRGVERPRWEGNRDGTYDRVQP